MQLLNRLSIRSKLYAGFAIVSAALLVAVAVGWMSMLSVSGTVRNGYEQAVIAEATSKWAYNMRVSQSQSAAIGHHIKNADGSDMHATDKAAYDKEFAQLKARATSAQDRAAIARITAARAKWGALDQKVIDLWTSGDKQGAVALANGAANTAGDNLSTGLDNYATQLEATAAREKGSRQRQAEVLMGIFIAIAVALALGIAVILTRRIAGGLKPIQARLNSLAENCLTETREAFRVDRPRRHRHHGPRRNHQHRHQRDRIGRGGVLGVGRAGLRLDRGDGRDRPRARHGRPGPERDRRRARPARQPVHAPGAVGATRRGSRGTPGHGPVDATEGAPRRSPATGRSGPGAPRCRQHPPDGGEAPSTA